MSDVRGSITLLHCSLLKFALLQNCLLFVYKLLGTSESLLCPVPTSQLTVVSLFDVLQLLMLLAGTLMFLETKLFFLITFYSISFFLLIINFTECEYMIIVTYLSAYRRGLN
jgi:hypothetical protein